MFRDITPMLANPQAFSEVVKRICRPLSRGETDGDSRRRVARFIFAAPLALELGASFIPVRKPGKLPFKTRKFTYELEYGTDALEMHVDAVAPAAPGV